ncbi:hypothetical protein A5819_003667 [Enterococcus sp. 7E2_DIV0204]|uniref:hypothetical protein n=1 Tax=unclassified Enterococcus TaxID=2608891 RepID=UPI000A342D97|nr:MULTISPECIES: hypothetical protein [unclassified Enterococcus]OTN83848.1 hypothetical protein A5819_003667 [Enterococcus sp. 7E2_DIV0204]OTP47510.1 hypothetical protein A5884_003481 [Enterococcus sp. 7D2_DIV0200]
MPSKKIYITSRKIRVSFRLLTCCTLIYIVASLFTSSYVEAISFTEESPPQVSDVNNNSFESQTSTISNNIESSEKDTQASSEVIEETPKITSRYDFPKDTMSNSKTENSNSDESLKKKLTLLNCIIQKFLI